MIEPTLWPDDAVEARDDAVASVAASEAPWVAVAFDALRHACARSYLYVTSEDVWAVMEERGYTAPGEPRAMGPVLQRGVREGLIEPHDFVQGSRASRHAAPIRRYRVVGVDLAGWR